MNTINALVFDFDDTLMDTRARRFRPLIDTFKSFGCMPKREDISRNWGKPFDALVVAIAPSVNYEAFVRRYSVAMRKFPPRTHLGAKRLLRILQQRGVPSFIVSSGSKILVKQDLDYAGLSKYVSFLWGFEDTPYHKPDPRTLEPVLAVFKNMALPRGNILFVGDSLADFQMAAASRIPFCAVLTGATMRKDFNSAGLEDRLIVDSLRELVRRGSWFIRALPPRNI